MVLMLRKPILATAFVTIGATYALPETPMVVTPVVALAQTSLQQHEIALFGAAVWAIKTLGLAASLLLIWYTKRLITKLEKAVTFHEEAPANVWERVRAMERALEDLKQPGDQE